MFCDAGGTLIDTAAAYGAGDAERIVGKLVRELGNRDEVVIATKAGFVIRDGKRIVDTSRRALLRDLDGSLRRLQSDYIDLWQIHAWGKARSRNRSMRSITRSRRAGALRECRTSWAGKRHRPPTSVSAARRHQCQVEYSLLARRAEVEVLPAVRALAWDSSVVTTGPRRTDRAIPEWHPTRIAGGD